MLVLTASTYNGAPSERLTAAFDETGGTIGRAKNNHMVLPDGERTVSRVQARIVLRNGGYVIVDRGSNPIVVNGKEIGRGSEEPLMPGDTLQIGGYVLLVSAGRAAAATDPVADPFEDTGASAHRIASPDAWPVTSSPAPLNPRASAPAAAPAPKAVPDNSDPPATPAPPPPANAGDPLEALLRPPAPRAPPGAVLSWTATGPQPAAPPLAGARTSILPLAAAEAPRAAPAPRAASAPIAAAAPSAAPDALLASLLDGLGEPGLRVGALTPGLMRQIGLLLRESAHGTVELLAARTALKREVGAEVTTIAARENNPLKFSPSVEVALQHLLGTPTRGFMPAPEAMRDAFDDLRAHQIGVLAGMRAALAGLLARFDPAQLEATLAPRSGLANLIPARRKARLWESFEALYSQLSREAEAEFHQLFGEAFLHAYEAHIAELQRGDTPPA